MAVKLTKLPDAAPTQTPTIEDALIATDALATAEAGISTVLLFGSTARGEQVSSSDIDLVVVFDDLDYKKRLAIQHALEKIAGGAADFPVHVHVTDWPEWRHRSESMDTTFERAIQSEVLPLRERTPNEVNWSKEIGMPNTDYGEALLCLQSATMNLRTLLQNLSHTQREKTFHLRGDASNYSQELAWRLSDICHAAQMAIENSIKGFIHIFGEEPPVLHHKLPELAKQVSDKDTYNKILNALELLTGENISRWRVNSTYVRPFYQPATAEDSRAYISTAETMVQYLINSLGGQPDSGQQIAKAIDLLKDTQSLRAEKDLDILFTAD